MPGNNYFAGWCNLSRQKMCIHLYILKSKVKNRYYTGITSLIPKKRLKYHNSGKVKSTDPYKPWVLVYTEKHKDYKDARKREKQIKSWKGGNAFKKLIARAAGSSNGRTHASGA